MRYDSFSIFFKWISFPSCCLWMETRSIIYLRHKNVNVVFWCHGFDVIQTRIACSHVYCMWHSSNTNNNVHADYDDDETHTDRDAITSFSFYYCLAINNFSSLTWLIAFNIDPLPLILDYVCIGYVYQHNQEDNEKRRLHVHRHTHKEEDIYWSNWVRRSLTNTIQLCHRINCVIKR